MPQTQPQRSQTQRQQFTVAKLKQLNTVLSRKPCIIGCDTVQHWVTLGGGGNSAPLHAEPEPRPAHAAGPHTWTAGS